jgi:hypothetical protein
MTPGGVVATQIKAAGLPGVGSNVFRDQAPEGQGRPYVTFIDGLSDVADLVGDSRVLRRRRLLQLDLWQDGLFAEDLTLIDALVAAVDGFKPGAYTHFSVTDVQRLYEPVTQIVHHAVTVQVVHS